MKKLCTVVWIIMIVSGVYPAEQAEPLETVLAMIGVSGLHSLTNPETSGQVKVRAAPQGVAVGNRCPTITGTSRSDEQIRGDEQVRIAVNASDPDGDEVVYLWITYDGTLRGQSSQVVWTAPECDPLDNSTRVHEIRVDVSDNICTADHVFSVSVVCGSDASGTSSGTLPQSPILFELGRTQIDNFAKARLDALAALLKQSPEMTIVVTGHTDSTGDEAVNQRIGQKRAENVKAYLVQQHTLEAKRIITRSYGSKQPVAPNDTPAGRARNRRVEVSWEFRGTSGVSTYE